MNSIITLILSLGTLLVSISILAVLIVVYSILREWKEQRKNSDRPTVILGSTKFSICVDKSEEGIASNFSTNASLERCGDLRIREIIPLHAYNIGAAVAKKIEISFNLNLHELVDEICRLDISNTVNIDCNENTIRISGPTCSGIYFRKADDTFNTDYVLPINVTNDPISVPLPSYYLELCVLLFHLTAESCQDYKFAFPNIPPFEVLINYQDIHNNEYQESIAFETVFNEVFLPSTSENHLQANCTLKAAHR